MAFSQRLDVRQGQSLVMTPQLQQAIKLLQLSNIELAAYVEQEPERNPLLQRDDSENQSDEHDHSDSEDYSSESSNDMSAAQENLDAPTEDAYEADSPSESAVEAHGSASSGSGAGSTNQGTGKGGGDDVDFESFMSSEKTLRDHLKDQLTMAGLNEVDQLIASDLILRMISA